MCQGLGTHSWTRRGPCHHENYCFLKTPWMQVTETSSSWQNQNALFYKDAGRSGDPRVECSQTGTPPTTLGPSAYLLCYSFWLWLWLWSWLSRSPPPSCPSPSLFLPLLSLSASSRTDSCETQLIMTSPFQVLKKENLIGTALGHVFTSNVIT